MKITFLLSVLPVLINGTVILPGLFNFDTPMAKKLICSSNNTTSLSLTCYNEAKLKIISAQSGSQVRDVCLFPKDIEVQLDESCHEHEKTLNFFKERLILN